MKLSFLTLAVLLVASPVCAQQAPSAAAPRAAIYDISGTPLHRNATGSRNAVKAMTLQPERGSIVLKPSLKFRTGSLFDGFDLAAALDSACPH